MRARTLDQLFQEIQTFPKVFPEYDHKGEGGINPAYTPVDDEKANPIPKDQPMIFCLRGDGTLAIGLKNASEYDTDKIEEHFSENVTNQLDPQNRCGHPTLAMPEGNYDGSVYYAGWLCQREGYLQVYLMSGRFQNTDLTSEQTRTLQIYIALQFRNFLGEQNVIFQESINYFELVGFIHGRSVQDPGIKYSLENKIENRTPILNKAQRLFQQREVNPRFFRFVYTLDQDGKKYSVEYFFPKMTLKNYIRSINGSLTLNNVKLIFGQLILGVAELHQKNLAHRNITTETVLIFMRQGELNANLTSLSCIIPVKNTDGTILDEETFTIAGSCETASSEDGTVPPYPAELKPCIQDNPRRWISMPESYETYKKINLKANDCYSLGIILTHLINGVRQEYVPDNQPIFNLIDGLMKNSLAECLTIDDILEHPFFASANQSAKEFFQELKTNKAFDDTLAIRTLKPFYALAEQFDSRFENFYHLIESAGVQKSPEGMYVLLEELNSCFKALQEKIAGYLINPNLEDAHPILKEIEKRSQEKMEMVRAKLDEKIKKAHAEQPSQVGLFAFNPDVTLEEKPMTRSRSLSNSSQS